MIECSEPAHISIDGRLVNAQSGLGVPAGRISLVATGPGHTIDSVTATSDADGIFQVSSDVLAGSTADLIVAAPGADPYRITNVPCPPSTVHGGACTLGSITSVPTFPLLAELHYRPDFVAIGDGLTVSFRRTGGAALRGPGISNGVYTATSNSGGRFPLFGDAAVAVGTDPVIGDLTVVLPPPLGQTVVHDIAVTPSIEYHPATQLSVFGVGPSLGYYLLFFDAKTKQPLSGVSVRFAQTGGIQATVPTVEATSDVAGKAWIGMRPLAAGSMDGTLTIQAPGAAGPTSLSVSLPTFDSDVGQLFESFLVGSDGSLTALPPGTIQP